ncbi:hypothetical protein [Bacillus phage CM1]|nr:hypothetical protein [Bacillus phage CM1]
MTHVFTERMAILKKMDYIEKERALLLAEYNSCFDRLRELDEIDRMSDEADHVAQVMKEAYAPEPKEEKVQEVFVPTYVTQEKWDELATQIKQLEQRVEIVTVSPQISRVVEAEQKITDEDIVTTKSSVPEDEDLLLPDVPVHKEGQTLQEYFEENKEVLAEMGETVEVKEDKPKEEPEKAPVGEASSMLQMKPAFMRGSTNDNRIIAQFAKVILKDYGVPIKAKKLLDKLRDAGISMNSPYETLTQIRNYEPSIQKAGHGYYQYVPTR